MGAQYIKATKNNLKPGAIVIKRTETGWVYGPMMLCMSFTKDIKKTNKVICCIHKQTGLFRSKVIDLSQLARVIDHRIKRKLKPDELFL